jgi:glycosyltransferase involved in cell wall biosynthesis
LADEILVSILCITYNHIDYISKAIDGFLKQKTDFCYEIIIHDDASTDKTAEIVLGYAKRYPDLIKTIIQKENQKSKGVKIFATYLFPAAAGKYIALCEGDDYWTNPLKLQRQVDFMKSNPSCSMCFHAADVIDVRTDRKIGVIRPFKKTNILPSEKLFFGGGNDVPTASILFLKKFVKDLPGFYFECPVGDHPLALLLSHHGKIGYIDHVMSVRTMWVPDSWNTRFISAKDDVKRISHIRAIIKLLVDYDIYTDHRYRIQIRKRIMSGEIEILQIQNKDPFSDDKFLELFSSFNKLDQYKIRIGFRLPILTNKYIKIKNWLSSLFIK